MNYDMFNLYLKNDLYKYKENYFMAKFVLIGGGENGRKGTKYETEKIDKEIVELIPENVEKHFCF